MVPVEIMLMDTRVHVLLVIQTNNVLQVRPCVSIVCVYTYMLSIGYVNQQSLKQIRLKLYACPLHMFTHTCFLLATQIGTVIEV